jgi:2-polyprenyl-3-methyl-5-hydroxy-6-metoxy-1,4-benzoquinol methylase
MQHFPSLEHVDNPADIRRVMIGEISDLPVERMLDVGCGPIKSDYGYSGFAKDITCVDWNVRVAPDIPSHITVIDGDFTKMDFDLASFDLIICADVFEHVQLEAEAGFVDRCYDLLKPGGQLIVSVPHSGRYAWLDPYDLKPRAQRILSKFGLYSALHNGTCDIRKGHHHYSEQSLAQKFIKFDKQAVRRFGLLAEPLFAWTASLRKRGVPMPGQNWILRKLRAEAVTDPGRAAYSIVIRFQKPVPEVAR